jgi:aminoglycoside/choline kinase family phosphotransferase
MKSIESEDLRLRELSAWLSSPEVTRAVGAEVGEGVLAPASADASFRRYFRITHSANGGGTYIAMDAPPPQEDCRPFVRVARLMREAGLNAPVVHAANMERGFLLLTDLGRQTYLDVLNESNVDALMRDATDALIKWQLASQPGQLPAYDEALLRREISLFPDWFIARHLNVTLTDQQRQSMEAVFQRIIASNLAQAQVYVHCDFMPRNLMASSPNPAVLDFQDALYGPIGYDIASLWRDAFVSWEEERVLDGIVRYWEKAKKAGLPVPSDFGAFYRDVEWMGLQRHLRIMGIFARIHYRDGKPRYLADTPRFARYIRRCCERYDELAPLARLFDALQIDDGLTRVSGVSF